MERAIIAPARPCRLKRMSRQPFEMVSHTADIGMLIRGRDREELLLNAAQALYSNLFRATGLAERLERVVTIDSPDGDALLIDWLNELIYLFDTDRLAFSRFEVELLTECRLRVRCFGEYIDTSRHRVVRDVKAATYHEAHVQRVEDGYAVRVIFDV